MTDSENRDDDGGGRTNRPAPRDPRPLFRDELQEPAPQPDNPTVALPAPPVQRRAPAPDATKVMPVQPPPASPARPARSRRCSARAARPRRWFRPP